MEWTVLTPVVVAIIMFLLIGTIWERRIETRLRQYAEIIRPQILRTGELQDQALSPQDSFEVVTRNETILLTSCINQPPTIDSSMVEPASNVEETHFNPIRPPSVLSVPPPTPNALYSARPANTTPEVPDAKAASKNEIAASKVTVAAES